MSGDGEGEKRDRFLSQIDIANAQENKEGYVETTCMERLNDKK